LSGNAQGSYTLLYYFTLFSGSQGQIYRGVQGGTHPT
jgi:hypothetical protein